MLKRSLPPLAHRLRPQVLSEFVGQEHLLGEKGFIALMLARGHLDSMVLWGPPGCGKTTLAILLAGVVEADFFQLSAVTAGVADIRKIAKLGRENREQGRRTVLFLDEIHRFNKAQQDFLLAPVEEGSLILLGATTENPSFSIITPLLSRARVAVLKALDLDASMDLLRKAMVRLADDYGREISVAEEVLQRIAAYAEGDARRGLNLLEMAFINLDPERAEIAGADLKPLLEGRGLAYDRDGEEHFNQISAFIKSMRAGDPDAALYWLGRMLESGEEPLYLARRMIRFASEDVGNAAPQALQLAINARQAYEILGSPEGELALYQVAAYLTTAPKSDAVYLAMKRVVKEIKKSGNQPVPMQVRNAPTGLMQNLGYGDGYVNPHRDRINPGLIAALPEKLAGAAFYQPTGNGYEATVCQRLQEREQLLRELKSSAAKPADKRSKPGSW